MISNYIYASNNINLILTWIKYWFFLTRAVDDAILSILRSRYEECAMYHGQDDREICYPLRKIYEEASGAWFAKCQYYYVQI